MQQTTDDQLKLFSVRVTVQIDIPVVAETEEEARKICGYAWREELENIDDEDPAIVAEELDALPIDFEGCLAYWDPKHAADPRTAWKCDDWFPEDE